MTAKSVRGTVWCVCVGTKYTPEHVKNLYKMVKKNMPGQFQMICLTDNQEMLQDITLPFTPMEVISKKPGWWQKIDLFELARRPSIYFDLDTIITGDLTPLLKYCDDDLAMPKNWALSGHGGFQSSVMCWRGKARGVQWNFDESLIGEPERGNYGYYREPDSKVKHWGDQEYLTYHHKDKITEIEEGLIVSYRYACRQKLPKKAIVVSFHGKPDYWEVNEQWINTALS